MNTRYLRIILLLFLAAPAGSPLAATGVQFPGIPLRPGRLSVAIRERPGPADPSGRTRRVKGVITLSARDETGEEFSLRSVKSGGSWPIRSRRRVTVENNSPPRRRHPGRLPPRQLSRVRRDHRLEGLRIFIPDRQLELDFGEGFISSRREEAEAGGLAVEILLPPDAGSRPEVRVSGAGFSSNHPVDVRSARAERPFYYRSFQPHRVRLVAEGADALQARLEMISRARETIDLEYYLFDTSQASTRMIVQALAEKARRGVRVRILRDHTPFGSRFSSWLAALLREKGVEVRIYNPAWEFNPWQFRAHRKMIIVDGKEAITGGRNIADAYFGLDRTKNFIDLDLWIEGEVVEVMGESFEAFWNSKYSRPAAAPRAPRPFDYLGYAVSSFRRDSRHRKRRLEAARRKYLDPEPLGKYRDWIEEAAGEQRGRYPVHRVENIVFCSDRPENPAFHRVVAEAIFDRLNQAEEPLRIMAPYFIPLRRKEREIGQLLERGIELEILGNSRFSYDDVISIGYVIESSARTLVRQGLKFYGYSGQPPPGEILPREDYRPGVYWEFHSKAAVLGSGSVMIGSYNFNPRSKLFNSETAIFIEDSPELARELGELFDRTASAAFLLNSRGEYDCEFFRELAARGELPRRGLLHGLKTLFTNTLSLFARDMM